MENDVLQEKVMNLVEGKIYKNWKEVCDELNISYEKYKRGGSKKYMVNKLKNFSDYSYNKNYTYIFHRIYEPNKYLDININEDDFRNLLQINLLNFLIHSKRIGRDVISINQIFKFLNLTTDNYYKYLKNHKELSGDLNVNELLVEEHYTLTYSTLKYNIESTLKKLSNKSKLLWNKAYAVDYLETIPEKYKDIVSNYIEEDGYKPKHKHHVVNKEQYDLITECEKIILERMKFDSKQEVVFNKKLNIFRKNVIKLMNEKSPDNIEYNYYYKGYQFSLPESHIKYLKDDIDNIMNSKLIELKDTQLRKLTMEKLLSNATSRMESVKEEWDKYLNGEKLFLGEVEHVKKMTFSDIELLRLESSYLDNVEKIINKLH